MCVHLVMTENKPRTKLQPWLLLAVTSGWTVTPTHTVWWIKLSVSGSHVRSVRQKLSEGRSWHKQSRAHSIVISCQWKIIVARLSCWQSLTYHRWWNFFQCIHSNNAVIDNIATFISKGQSLFCLPQLSTGWTSQQCPVSIQCPQQRDLYQRKLVSSAQNLAGHIMGWRWSSHNWFLSRVLPRSWENPCGQGLRCAKDLRCWMKVWDMLCEICSRKNHPRLLLSASRYCDTVILWYFDNS